LPHTTTLFAAAVVNVREGAPETGLEGEFLADAGEAASCALVHRDKFIECQQDAVGEQDTVMDEPPDVTTPVHNPTYVDEPEVVSWRFVHVIPPPVAVGVPIVAEGRSSVNTSRTKTSLVAGVKEAVVRAVELAAVELTW
jgi:hypothetical protein